MSKAPSDAIATATSLAVQVENLGVQVRALTAVVAGFSVSASEDQKAAVRRLLDNAERDYRPVTLTSPAMEEPMRRTASSIFATIRSMFEPEVKL